MSNGLAKFVSFGLIASGAIISHADIVNFQSGNGAGAQDAYITTLSGDSVSDFPTLTAADFSAAQSGNHAYILSPLAAGWVSNLGDGSSAKWVGVDPTGGNNAYNSHSALYAINFNLNSAASDATLNLRFSVDDTLGGSNNEGLFIDGHAIAGSVSQTDWNNQIENKSFDVGALSSGTHTLYFDVVNSGNGPSGVIFNGNIHTQAVPEPAPFAALGLGAIGLIRRRTKKA